MKHDFETKGISSVTLTGFWAWIFWINNFVWFIGGVTKLLRSWIE